MPSKAEFYRQMAEQVSTRLVGSWQEWTAFLSTAARLYKYPFHEQMMIYAQRPDATACAEYDLWNEKMGRYVRRGSKGIALVDDSGDRPRLRYVFDISDTGTRPNSRTPWLWQLEEQHIGPVSAMLERNYGIAGDDLAQQLTDVAEKLASEYWDEHQQDFRYIVDGSFLEEYDDLNVAVQFKSAATVSIAYALMSRCGLEPERYFQHEDFMSIFDFNTPATVGALGAAVSQINQQVLRQIGVTIQNYEREHIAERSMTHGEQSDLHEERRLPDSRSEPERAAEEAPGQVRQDAESVLEGTPAPDLQPSADEREAVPAPAGDRGDGEQPSGADDASAGGVGGRDGGTESPRSDALGGPDEHLQGTGRGDSDGGAYQQLTLNLFLSEAEQIQRIDEAENVKTSSAFSFTQEQPQPEAADQEAEAAKPTLRELHEKYKPIVLEAVSQDIRYRNACGHSDYENAMIECNAAVRRAILDSHDIELIRLFSDVPEFRQRLHREVADETYPKLHELLRPLSDNDIDCAIQNWNGKIESKHAVVRYMKKHGREKDTAAWLAHEFDGGNGKTPFAIRPESPNGMALPWPKVQRRIAQLIKEDRFYTQVEKDNLDDVDPIAIRETLAQRGIVDGQVVDPEKLDGDPFVQRVMADAQRIAAEETSEQPTPPDLSGQPITRAGDTITIGNGDTVHEIDITVSDEEYEAIRQTIPDEKADDPSAPIYHVGDTVYLENQEYRITELREDTVQLLPTGMSYPIYRAESRERFEQLLREDTRNEATTAPQPLNPETVDQEHTEPPAETLRSGSEQTDESETPPQPAPGNFRIMDDNLGTGGPKEKFWRNIKAIATLKQIEQENRHATLEEQHLLSQYVGWGGIPDAFDPEKPAWAAEYSELKELLTPEEYAAARGSTLNAHYTSPTVIRAIYEAVGRMGFKTGNILEPSCGVGNFFGMLPESMAGSKLYGVELDSISGRIARQLYPKADITVAGFENTDRRDFYDLAIGNVPFGQYLVNDKAYNKLGFNIHNYFFAKALDQVRPGGVVAFVTSRYTMDAKDSTVRRYLAQRAELLGAIRLPNNAFRANAGTDVVSDIIFLQRRERPLDIVPEWTQTGQTEDGFTINRYFIDHPEMVLGRQEPESTAHGMDYTVNPIEGLELADQLHDAVKYIRGTYQEAELPELGEDEAIDTSIPADPNVKNYSYTVVDGAVYYRENSRMVRPDLNATAEARVKGLVGLRECVQQLIDLQMDAATSDSDIREKQAELNQLYDDFSTKYGLINDRANRLAFADDSSYYLLCALEVIDEDGKLERKADMFTKRTIKPHEAVTSVDTASEALAVSIAEKARVDMEYMEQLTGKTGDKLVSELQGVIFRVPGQVEKDGTPHYVTADEYLSGNVRRKLRQAQRAAQQDSTFAINVEALTAAQPKDLDASEIEVRLGATWIDKKYIQQFMYETFNTPYYLQRAIQVNYAAYTAGWQVTGKSSVSENDVAAYTTYGTSRANAYKILEDSLNLRDVRIYDTVEDADGKERRVLNARETTLAAQKQQAIRDAFKDWIWRDPERRQTLVRQYNEEMNSTRPREYDGSHITFGGMTPSITLRDHQLGAIAHILYGGNTLLAHEVGAGKTFEMVAAAMEAKRLGLCQKSLFVVPNHLTEQWASEFLRLYPSAKILVTTKKDFETHNRKKFCARIATGDYDAVIIGHSQFEKIPISHERQERLLQEQIDEITEGIAEVKFSGGERFTVKQLERTKKSLEARLEKLQAEGRKDDVVTFEQLGVDRLFVDEAHNYKNLFLYTKMRNVAGLSTSDAQKSSDMFAKCRYMDEITGSRGVIFATGTPVSNSMTVRP